MSKKLNDKGKQRTLPVTFSIKEISDDGADTVIEGWANKAVVDRGMDYIGKSAWDLKNFNKNPVILFNHDKDKPIGKALGVEATDDGLFIKAKISKSKDPMVSYVRDMIKEGILNAFSVGFDARDEVRDEKGVNEIKRAELYEVSVVSLPMNQDSIFTLTSKDLKVKTYTEARKKVLDAKGAQAAAAILSAIEQSGGDKDAICEGIAETTGAKIEDVKASLTGDLTPIPEDILKAFAGTLDLKIEDLQKINGSDVVVEEGTEASSEAPSEKSEDVQSVMIPKSSCGGDMEKAAEMCKEAGYSCDNMKEEGDYFVSEQAPADQFEELKEVDLEDGCIGKVGFKKEVVALDPANENPPENTTVEQEEKPVETKSAGGPMDMATEVGKDENPYLQQTRQTNILLSSLIVEFQKLSKLLEGVKIVETQEAIAETVEQEPEVEDSIEEQKTVDIVSQKLKALDDRLKSMGV